MKQTFMLNAANGGKEPKLTTCCAAANVGFEPILWKNTVLRTQNLGF